MRLSAPPARTMSASLRSIRRNASPTACVPAAQAVVIVLLGPCALNASEMWAATMFGKYFRIHKGKRAPAPFWPKRLVSSLPSLSQASMSAGVNSGRSTGTRPVPITTPIRVGSSLSRSSPESWSPRPAAPTAKRMARDMIFMLLRCLAGIKGATSKSCTSAAILTGCPVASKLRMGPTPLVPFKQADQKASLPTPLGATTPRPVMTTLRIPAIPHRKDLHRDVRRRLRYNFRRSCGSFKGVTCSPFLRCPCLHW